MSPEPNQNFESDEAVSTALTVWVNDGGDIQIFVIRDEKSVTS